MADVVMVTGAGRSYALGFNLVLRYLEAGDTVIATVRKPSGDVEALKEKYGNRLIVACMDLKGPVCKAARGFRRPSFYHQRGRGLSVLKLTGSSCLNYLFTKRRNCFGVQRCSKKQVFMQEI